MTSNEVDETLDKMHSNMVCFACLDMFLAKHKFIDESSTIIVQRLIYEQRAVRSDVKKPAGMRVLVAVDGSR